MCRVLIFIKLVFCLAYVRGESNETGRTTSESDIDIPSRDVSSTKLNCQFSCWIIFFQYWPLSDPEIEQTKTELKQRSQDVDDQHQQPNQTFVISY